MVHSFKNEPSFGKVVDPEIHRNVVELNMVRDLLVGADVEVSFTLALTIPACPLRDQIAEDARRAVGALPDVNDVQVTLGAMTDEERNAVLGVKPPQQSTDNKVGRMIAVMSGKGGVGKSLVTGLLAQPRLSAPATALAFWMQM